MKISILAFGIAKDILGAREIEIEIPASSLNIAGLKDQLSNTYPDFKKLRSLALAVNEEYVADELELNHGDQIVIIPPVSGG
ncbi:UNVERIFIED_CONTAM: hypothetical protein GTU68_052332 [Idotea baltica]|nr:hypothetical protein [Idotea baltica]